jgi:3-methylcrotonyl-CoA carboxylase alpha subunit
MDFEISLNGRRRRVRVKPLGGGAFAAWLDGKEHRLNAVETEPSVYSLLLDGVSFEAAVEWKSRDEACVSLYDGEYDAVFENPLRAALGAVEREGAEARVVSPMPGKVTRVMAEPGQKVRKGQPLAAVEAMKMENELRAPRDGTVRAVRAAPGDRVERGSVLIIIM